MAKIAEQIELMDKIKPLLAGHDPEPPIREDNNRHELVLAVAQGNVCSQIWSGLNAAPSPLGRS
jgi:hypothetical protein